MDIKVNEKTVIVFDLDDTLYNEMAYLKSAYSEIALEISPENWKALYAKMYSLFRSKEDVFGFVSSTYNVSKTELLEQYRTHVPKLKLFDGVLDFMHEIKAKEGKIGIITDGRKSTQRTKLKALGITDLIDKIVISEEIGSEKPAIRNYKLIEEVFKDCIYLYMADNLRKDFISPNLLGWQTLGLVDNGLNMHFDGHLYFDKEHAPQAFVHSFNEINII